MDYLKSREGFKMEGLRNYHSVIHEQKFFEQGISLIGSKVKIQLHESTKPFLATVVNSMFDSLLVEVDGNRKVIRFIDIVYLDRA